MDLCPVGIVLPFGPRSKGKACIVGLAIVLLSALEVTSVTAVLTGGISCSGVQVREIWRRAAYVARLGRQIYNKSFIVAAIYIENTGKVTRYFVFQPDDVDPTVRSLEFKQSCVFSLGLLGSL